jgi:hypothetical protein
MLPARAKVKAKAMPGNTKGGKYHCTVDLLFDCFGLVCFANKKQKFTADSKPVKQEVNGTVIRPL